jgi:hypothetical protein
MTHETVSTHKPYPDHVAKLAELNRLAALVFHGQPTISAVDADFLDFEMALPDFWLRLFGADSMDAIAAILDKCNAVWRPRSQEPITYLDKDSGARKSMPFLGKSESGDVFTVQIDYCDREECEHCPSWESAGRFARLPESGPNRLIGWLSLDDVLSLEGHTFHPMPLHQDGVQIGSEHFSEQALNIFLKLHQKLEHGSDDEKQALRALISAYQHRA